MKIIYETKGKANEYNGFALDIYKTCDHNCKYCYLIKNRDNTKILKRDWLMEKLEDDIKEYKEKGLKDFIFLSFSTDPYNIADTEYKETRKVLELLSKNNIPVMILTKGWKRLLRDLDIIKTFGNRIKIGMTIVFASEEKKCLWEKNTTTISERIEVLKILKENGIKTWISMEPIIDTEEAFKVIELTKDFVDEYKVWKINYFKDIEDKVDWKKFTIDITEKLKELGKEFYIKESLMKYMKEE